MKDTAQKEAVVLEKLFDEITDEEIDEKSRAILRVSLIDDLKRNVAVIKLQKDIGSLTEQENEVVNQEIQKIDIDTLIERIRTGELSQEQQETLEEYKVDIEKHKKRVENKEQIKSEIRKDKMEKLKAGITLGIEAKGKIDTIRSRIDGERTSDEDIAQLVYGLSWYIGLDREGKVIERQINPEMDKQGVEQEMYERTLREFKEAKKEELGLPSMRNATEDVSAEDKQEKLRQMNHERKDKTQDKALEVGGVEEQ